MCCAVEAGGFRLSGDDSRSRAADEYDADMVPATLCSMGQEQFGKGEQVLLLLVSMYKLMLKSAMCDP